MSNDPVLLKSVQIISPIGSVAISNSNTLCVRLFTFRCAAMPPKQMSESSGFSLAAWMLPKPTADGAEQQNTEHKKTDDQTPSPTEVVDSSQKIPSPTEVANSPETNPKAWFEYHVAYENDDNDDYYDDGVATDEAAAMAELVQEASLADTLQCNTGVKRKREDEAGRGKDTGERKPGQETVLLGSWRQCSMLPRMRCSPYTRGRPPPSGGRVHSKAPAARRLAATCGTPQARPR